jgi:DNA-binding NarL/FixJ family response regulator
MKAGARAILLKTLLDKQLLETIRAVHAGLTLPKHRIARRALSDEALAGKSRSP